MGQLGGSVRLVQRHMASNPVRDEEKMKKKPVSDFQRKQQQRSLVRRRLRCLAEIKMSSLRPEMAEKIKREMEHLKAGLNGR